ncbi:hypothetical protein EIP91_007707, partial [Steccherinum ochraceum]
MPPKLKTQYHHYVPRFMLRKWKVEYTPPPPDASPDPSTSPTSPSRKRRGGRGRKRSGPSGGAGHARPEDYIQAYNVQTDVIQVGTPIAKAFGNTDMYKNDDEEDAANVFRVEELFSKLESQAAQILQKLDKAISGADASTSVKLTRKEVNTLRKFLFLLSYRNEHHAAQYLEERFDPMTKKEVDAFRVKEGLKDSYAVFLSNLRNFLESEHWEIPDNQHILRSDRDAYHTELHARHLAFFIAPDDAEFVITNNGLGLWEGTDLPSLSLFMNILTPGCNPGEANWKHTTTYPVSPRLLVMLRSNAMMPMQKFLDAGFTKEEAAAATPSVWGDKIPDNSYYKDFPRSMASVRYVPPVRGHDALAALIQNQRELGRRVDDVLTFQLHMLSSEQSFRVNSLRLENSPVWLTFKSPRKLIETLR